MAANPPSTPPSPDPTVLALLNFARETADGEVANIERLHHRTLLSLTIIVSVFGLIFGFLGWLGYDHLRDAAIAVARTQMQETVSGEVAKLMDKEHVDDAVKEVLIKRAEADLVATINKHVGEEIKKRKPDIERTVREGTTNAVNVMKPQIKEVASAEAKSLVAEFLAPRHFSQKQADELKVASEKYHGRDFRVSVRAYSDDAEEKHYASEITNALDNAGWIAVLGSPSGGYGGNGDLPDIGGAFIAVETPQQPPFGTIELQEVLGRAGLKVPIEKGSGLTQWAEVNGTRYAPTLVIGSRF
jgi:hypothetical protein